MIPYIFPYAPAYYFWNYFVDGNWFPVVCSIVILLAYLAIPSKTGGVWAVRK
jgi:hypothetical protein